MRTLLAMVAGLVVATAMPVAAQEQKAAPDEAHQLLTQQNRMAMTHARRVEMAEAGEKDAASAEIDKLGRALEAASSQLEEIAPRLGAEQALRLEQMRKSLADARAHYEQLKAVADRPTSQAAKTAAAAVRESVDAAETAHQKMMATAPAAKPDTTKSPPKD